MNDIIIIGGGLAGLINSILLGQAGLKVLLIEKNQYPFHRVCGEYISNEVLPFLEKHNLFPSQFEPPQIDELELSSTTGRHFIEKLDLGGFGISRFTYDQWLSTQAINVGVTLLENTKVTDVQFQNDSFVLKTGAGNSYQSKIVIGAHGKRSKLDQSLSRGFLSKKSPYVGVKYHIKTNHPDNRISLHNFEGGYCGISKIENDQFNLCYLTHRDAIRRHGNIPEFERNVMWRNPHLKSILSKAEFVFEKPEVINEITFEKQEPLLDHILMCGDAAGMITPLCGNGMAMAIHSASILSDLVIKNFEDSHFDRNRLESQYVHQWNETFARRLWTGRKIQHLFGSGTSSGLGVLIGSYLKPVSRFLISKTHGQPFS